MFPLITRQRKLKNLPFPAPAAVCALLYLHERDCRFRRRNGVHGSPWQWSVCPKVMSLALDRSSRHTLDKVPLEAEENDEHRQDTKHGTCNQYIIVVSVGCEQGV